MIPVTRHVLPNGLTVLLCEQHSAPVASAWTFYRVGGRDEIPGLTGASHWCEHMMFKGTPRFGKGVIDVLTSKNGGFNNGLTDLDYTCYLFTMPADRLGIALEILADLMGNAAFETGEVESERTVIISEREGHENNPAYQLLEDVIATAYHVHPYQHGVIGWKCDLQAMTRDDLHAHYRRFYAPNNAIAVVAGDFQTGAMLKQIETLFGAYTPGQPPPAVRSVEPPQEAERRVLLEKQGTTAYFRAVYHTPALAHADTPALIALDAILSGGKGMSYFGGSIGLYKSSRLYRALVETELAADVSSSYGLNRDPGLFDVTATVRDGCTLRAVEDAVFAELDRIASKPPSAAELAKAVKQTRAQFAYATERVTSQAYLVGLLECLNSYEDTALFTDRLADVSPRDVQRVAQTYLTRRNRTVGWFQPASGLTN
ncbi:MAG: insulinase family protein [Chloroflexi bacterium]|nr:insulinase family protein [Chloroflexota bacterium]